MVNFVQQLQWFIHPRHDHIVQFYPAEDVMLRCLQEFIRAGVANGDSCIVIATDKHLELVEEKLSSAGLDIDKLRSKDLLIGLDARSTLDSFMVDGLPNWDLFAATISPVVEKALKAGKEVRAYGEMVALLWEEGNIEALIKLEEFWNDLAGRYKFSLYCGYPSSGFNGRQSGIISEISHRHAAVI